MNNKIHYLTQSEFEKIQFDSNMKFVNINGSDICTWLDFWNAMSEGFSFPSLPDDWNADFYSYFDLMEDLDWITESGIVLIIKNFNDFFRTEPIQKEKEINTLKDYILPFWEEDVEHVVVGGKKRSFNVYCVD